MGTKPQHVIVSGGSRGLGQAIVEALLDGGFSVSTFSRSPSPFTEQLEESFGDRFLFLPGDLSDPAQIPPIVKKAIQRFGKPYALINNAGIAREGVLATVPESDIAMLLSVNLAGTLYLTRAVSRAMLLQREGRIINISSIIGLRGYRGLSVYAATKGALDAATRALARELGERQITVNSIAPGYLDTEMTHELEAGQKDQIIRRTPLGRLGKPQDVTGLVLFLLRDEARFITGQTFVVDGGISC